MALLHVPSFHYKYPCLLLFLRHHWIATLCEDSLLVQTGTHSNKSSHQNRQAFSLRSDKYVSVSSLQHENY